MELGKNVTMFMFAGAALMAALALVIGHPCIALLMVAWVAGLGVAELTL